MCSIGIIDVTSFGPLQRLDHSKAKYHSAVIVAALDVLISWQPELAPMASPSSLNDYLLRTTGMVPSDPSGWLFVARGMFNSKPPQYKYVIEATSHCLKSPETIVQGQQLQAFSLLALDDNVAALSAFTKSVRMGNETDWQMVVELGLDQQDSTKVAEK